MPFLNRVAVRVCAAGALAASLAACAAPPREAPPAATAQPGLQPMTSRRAHAVPERMSEKGSVDGMIDVAPEHRKRIRGGTLFVIARSTPTNQVVAVRRYDAKTFPMQFSVSADDVMMEGAIFASPFDVTARWSRSGDAMPAPGDVEGVIKHVAVGQPNLRITLSELRP